MKSKIKTIIAAALLFGFSSSSWATLIVSSDGNNGIDVGMTDSIIAGIATNLGACGPGSSEASEECWAEGVLGSDLSLEGRAETVEWYFTDDSDLIAFELVAGPGFYLIKNSTTWILLENLADLDWGVLSFSDLDALGVGNLFPGNSENGCDADEDDCTMTFSHVTEWNGSVSVPEPGTLLLLGAGLLGFGARRRLAK